LSIPLPQALLSVTCYAIIRRILVPIDWDEEYMADEKSVNISGVRNAVILDYFYNYVKEL